VFNNTFSFTIFLPLPLSIPHSILSRLPIHHPNISSLLFRGPFLTELGALLTSAVLIDIAIAKRACSSARRNGIRKVVIIIIHVDYLIPIQWSIGQQVAWFVLPTAWRHNFSAEIISTVPREILTSAWYLTHSGYLRIRAIDLIPKATGIHPPPIVHLLTGYDKHLP
jgi:hypothetical protein